VAPVFKSNKRWNAFYGNLKRTFEDLLPWYCYAKKKTPRPEKIPSQVWPRKGVNMTELQAHHCRTPEQWTWLLCSVSVMPETTVVMQNINELIRTELLTSCFLENLGAWFQSQGGKYQFASSADVQFQEWWQHFFKHFDKIYKFWSLESRSPSRTSNPESRSRSFWWSLGLEIFTRSQSRRLRSRLHHWIQHNNRYFELIVLFN